MSQLIPSLATLVATLQHREAGGRGEPLLDAAIGWSRLA